MCVSVIPAQVEALVGSAAKGTCFGGMVAGGAGKRLAISRSSQCSTTGITKAVVCVILSVGWCI